MYRILYHINIAALSMIDCIKPFMFYVTRGTLETTPYLFPWSFWAVFTASSPLWNSCNPASSLTLKNTVTESLPHHPASCLTRSGNPVGQCRLTTLKRHLNLSLSFSYHCHLGFNEFPNKPVQFLFFRQLNPMYEGYLQHDAQEVLQCILASIQEACDTIKKEQTDNQKDSAMSNGTGETTHEDDGSSDGQLSGKRKSDTEAGNAKKKPKSQSKSKKNEENMPMTRSKRKSSGDITTESSDTNHRNGAEEREEKEQEKDRGSTTEEEKNDSPPKEVGKRTRRGKLGWLKPSGKQPSIFSKFRSMGRITSHVGGRGETKEKSDCSAQEKEEKDASENESRTQEVKQSLGKNEGRYLSQNVD